MSTSTTATTQGSTAQVDARLPRFIATLTAAVLATALVVAVVSPPAAAVILAAQAASRSRRFCLQWWHWAPP